MTFLEQLDPELAVALEAAPEIDLGRNIPKLRLLIERFEAPLRATLPPIPEVEVTDHLTLSADGTEVRVRVYARHRSRRRQPPHCCGSTAAAWSSARSTATTSCARRGHATSAASSRRSTTGLRPSTSIPAHIDDCYAGLQWLAGHVDDLGIDPRRIAIGGASAGGGLAAGTALLARDRGDVSLCFQYLVYPMIDDRDETPSTHEITFPKVWNRVSNQHGWAAYLGDRAGGADVPIYAAPARAEVDDLRGLPPAYIDVGELDPFRDEDIAYATRLLAAGVPCELHVTPGAFHGSEMSVPNAVDVETHPRLSTRRAHPPCCRAERSFDLVRVRGRLAGDEAHESNESEELIGFDATSGLRLQRRCHLEAAAGSGDQCVCTPIDDTQHVLRVGGLQVTVTGGAQDLETRGRQQARQPANQPDIVDECPLHRLDARLQRVVLTERHRDRRVIAIADREGASGSQDTGRLGQHLLRLGDVAEHRVHHHGVELAVTEVKRPTVPLFEVQHSRGPPRAVGPSR